jgi:hypothetical protein
MTCKSKHFPIHALKLIEILLYCSQLLVTMRKSNPTLLIPTSKTKVILMISCWHLSTTEINFKFF